MILINSTLDFVNLGLYVFSSKTVLHVWPAKNNNYIFKTGRTMRTCFKSFKLLILRQYVHSLISIIHYCPKIVSWLFKLKDRCAETYLFTPYVLLFRFLLIENKVKPIKQYFWNVTKLIIMIIGVLKIDCIINVREYKSEVPTVVSMGSWILNFAVQSLRHWPTMPTICSAPSTLTPTN